MYRPFPIFPIVFCLVICLLFTSIAFRRVQADKVDSKSPNTKSFVQLKQRKSAFSKMTPIDKTLTPKSDDLFSIEAGSISLTTLGTAYTQNFDTLANSGTTNVIAINGWDLIESGGGARDNEQYAGDDGGSTTGDTYSYGTASTTERAFGGLRSGTLIPTIGASFTNNTSATIKSLAISYTGEEWRLGTASRTDQLNFEYSTDATSLVTGTWTGISALNFVTPNTVTIGAKDGNAVANRTNLNSTITGLSITNGSTFWIRWTDTDATGADDGLAVDDFSLTPLVDPPLLTKSF